MLDDDDGSLLSDLGQRRQQPPGPHRVADPEVRHPAIQLMKLQSLRHGLVFVINRNELNAFPAELIFAMSQGSFCNGAGTRRGAESIEDSEWRSPPPVCLCILPADGLAFRLPATAPAVADPWIQIEPSKTIPAGALPRSRHPPLSARQPGGQLFAGTAG